MRWRRWHDIDSRNGMVRAHRHRGGHRRWRVHAVLLPFLEIVSAGCGRGRDIDDLVVVVGTRELSDTVRLAVVVIRSHGHGYATVGIGRAHRQGAGDLAAAWAAAVGTGQRREVDRPALDRT